jgi:hypothetical protein
MFGAQPPTQPSAGMSLYCRIGFADRTKAEVVRPTVHHLVELHDHCPMIKRGLTLARFVADCLTDGERSVNRILADGLDGVRLEG